MNQLAVGESPVFASTIYAEIAIFPRIIYSAPQNRVTATAGTKCYSTFWLVRHFANRIMGLEPILLK
jgi:hypothetical protein